MNDNIELDILVLKLSESNRLFKTPTCPEVSSGQVGVLNSSFFS